MSPSSGESRKFKESLGSSREYKDDRMPFCRNGYINQNIEQNLNRDQAADLVQWLLFELAD